MEKEQPVEGSNVDELLREYKQLLREYLVARDKWLQHRHPGTDILDACENTRAALDGFVREALEIAGTLRQMHWGVVTPAVNDRGEALEDYGIVRLSHMQQFRDLWQRSDELYRSMLK